MIEGELIPTSHFGIRFASFSPCRFCRCRCRQNPNSHQAERTNFLGTVELLLLWPEWMWNNKMILPPHLSCNRAPMTPPTHRPPTGRTKRRTIPSQAGWIVTNTKHEQFYFAAASCCCSFRSSIASSSTRICGDGPLDRPPIPTRDEEPNERTTTTTELWMWNSKKLYRTRSVFYYEPVRWWVVNGDVGAMGVHWVVVVGCFAWGGVCRRRLLLRPLYGQWTSSWQERNKK